MDKTHKIVFEISRIPYLVKDTASIGDKITIAGLKITQTRVFAAVVDTMFAAHGIKMKKEDKMKDDYDIYIDGTMKQCVDMLEKFQNLHQLDFTKAFGRIPFRFRKKVKTDAKQTKFEKMQDKLEQMQIYFDVKVVALPYEVKVDEL